MLAVKPEGADDFPQMHRLVWAFAARLCDRYHNLMNLNLGIAVITTFIELFTLRKPKLIFNCIKQNVRKYLEFDLVWACWVFIHFKLYVSEQRDPDEIAQTHMLSWALS